MAINKNDGVTVKFENKAYLWHNKIWSTQNITVSTALAQKLMVFAIKNGLLSKEDFIEKEDAEDKIELTKITKLLPTDI